MAKLVRTFGTGLLALSFAAPAATAADTSKLSMGGIYAAAAAAYDTSDETELKDIAFNQGTEIDFRGRTVLDNGLQVGFHTELSRQDRLPASSDKPGLTRDPAARRVDSVFVYIKSGAGMVALGEPQKISAPLDQMARYITNFTRPDDAGLSVPAFRPLELRDNGRPDNTASLRKLSYFTPRIGGMQFGVSFNTSNTRDSAPQIDLPVQPMDATAKSKAVEFAANYKTEFSGIKVELGGSYLNGAWQTRSADSLVQWGAGGSFSYSLPRIGGDLALAGSYRNTNCAEFICGTGLTSQGDTSSNLWNFGLRYSVGSFALGGYVLTGRSDNANIGLPNHTTTVFLQTAIDF